MIQQNLARNADMTAQTNKATYAESSYGAYNNKFSNLNKNIYSVQQRRESNFAKKPTNTYESKWV